MKRISIVLGTVGCLAALAGCTAREQSEAKGSAQDAGQKVEQGARKAGEEAREAAGKAGQALEGATLTARVKARLLTEKGLDNTEINVDSVGKSVVLKGTVQSDAQSELAEKVAAQTEGAAEVTNKLVVAPAGMTPRS